MTPSAERSLHHRSLGSEKNQRTEDKVITLMKKVCCQLSPFSHPQERGDPYTSQVRVKKESQVARWKTKESGFSLKDKKSKSSLKLEKFQADSDKKSIQELNGIIESQRREIDHTVAGDEQFRRDQLLLHEQLSEQNWDLREAQKKVFMRWTN